MLSALVLTVRIDVKFGVPDVEDSEYDSTDKPETEMFTTSAKPCELVTGIDIVASLPCLTDNEFCDNFISKGFVAMSQLIMSVMGIVTTVPSDAIIVIVVV